jgi:DNA-binding YbaB/EbfC family protein
MDIQRMMKQAQAMQGRMQELQARLGETEVSGASGGTAVQVVMTCKGEVRSLNISPDVIDPSDKETLEDLIMAAMNTARANADQLMADETRKMMAELGLPANAQLPF